LKSSVFILVNKRKNATSRLKTFVSKNYIHYLITIYLWSCFLKEHGINGESIPSSLRQVVKQKNNILAFKQKKATKMIKACQGNLPLSLIMIS